MTETSKKEVTSEETLKRKSIYDLFETSKEKESKGVTIVYKDYGEFTIARSGRANSRYQKRFLAALKPHRHQMDMGALDEEVATDLLIKVFAETIVLGWKNVYGKDGNEIKFNTANCIKVLTDLPDLFDKLREESDAFANFRAAELDFDVKN